MDKQQHALFDLHFIFCCRKYDFKIGHLLVSPNEYGLGNTHLLSRLHTSKVLPHLHLVLRKKNTKN